MCLFIRWHGSWGSKTSSCGSDQIFEGKLFRTLPFSIKGEFLGLKRNYLRLDDRVRIFIGRGCKHSRVRNESFVLVTRQNCETRLLLIRHQMHMYVWPRVNGLESRKVHTHKRKQVVEVAMRVDEKHLSFVRLLELSTKTFKYC